MPQRISVAEARPSRHTTRILLVLFFLTLPLVNPWVRGDGVGYYAYIRSMLIEHRLDFTNDWRHANTSFTMGRVHPDGTIDPKQYTSTGHLDNHFSVGPAILWAPFLVPVHLAALALERLGFPVRPDGFSRPYVVAMALATALYGFLGLLISFRLARLCVEERWALLATLGIWFASSLPVYMYFNPSWSHAHSAFVVGLFLWYWHRTRADRALSQWVILGLISGLMLDVYYANVALLMFPLLESLKGYWRGVRSAFGVRGSEFANEAVTRLSQTPKTEAHLRSLFTANLLYSVATVVAFSPTLIGKQIVYGHPLDMGYSDVIHWASPSFARVLFSSDHGLLTWTPVVILALGGLVLLGRLDLECSIYSLSAFSALCYLIACDSNWDGLSSFGNRFFLSLVPLFVVGLAVVLSQFAKWVKRVKPAYAAASALTILLVVWNLAFIFQWGDHLIPVRGPISWRQMLSNQVTVVPAQLGRQLGTYFSSRSSLMQQIEQKDVRQLKQQSP